MFGFWFISLSCAWVFFLAGYGIGGGLVAGFITAGVSVIALWLLVGLMWLVAQAAGGD